MNELRSVQFVCEQLRTRTDGIEVGTGVSDLSREAGQPLDPNQMVRGKRESTSCQ